MNYLKSITSTVLNSTGVSFPFTIGERLPGITSDTSIWEVREGVKKDDSTPLTLFIFDSTLPPLQPGNKDRRALMQLARNALKKLKTIRHPDVIKYIDSVESETHIYIATERVRPLEGVLREWQTGGAYASAKGKGKEHWIGWGVQSIATALGFLNAAPLSLHHAYLLTSSIFITPAMEWRLGGFDLLTARDDSAGVLWGLGGLAPGNIGEISGPEVRKGGWTVLRDTDPAQSDTYLLALLIFTLYNPSSPLPNLLAQPTPSSAGAIPKSLFPLWKRMLNPNPRTRLSTTSFVAEAASAGFWASNPLVSLVAALDGFELRSEGEKLAVLRTIKDAADKEELPRDFMMYKVLPMLLHSISLPTAPSGAMLPLVLELGKNVPQQEYAKMILDPVVRLYQSPDRGTRMALLDGLPEYAERLDQRTVSDKIWPHLITGFADTVPVIREATVKAVFPLSTKLTDRILNNDLLRLLAKMQTDTEPSIRTNTCILIGRLAPNLGTNTKKKVLVPAFARSLRDPFVHARVAGLMALMATVEIFDRDDLAGKVIPNMAFTMVDKEKLVRDQAFKAMGMFMQRVEGFAASMPDTVLSETQQSQSYGPVTTTSSTNAAGQAGLVNSAAGAAGALAGWAITSLSKQLASGEAHSSMSAAPAAATASGAGGLSGQTYQSSSGSGLHVPGGFGAPSSNGDSPRASIDSWTSAPSQQASSSRAPTVPAARPASNTVPGFGSARPQSSFGKQAASGSSGGGMKLGGNKAKAKSTTNAALDEVMGDWDDEGVENAWGTDDLIDVNADEDDWAAFESAPVPEIAVAPAQSYYVNPQSTLTAAKPNGAPKATAPKPSLAPAIPAASILKPSTASTAPAPAAKVADAASIPRSSAASPAPSASSAGTSAAPAPAANSLAGMSKDEKEAEMARRRDERKARIAAMKKGKA